MRLLVVVLVIAAGGLAASLLGGCTPQTRDKILPYFFDGFTEEVKPRPPTKRLRRDLLQEVATLERELEDARALAKAREAPAAADAALPVEQAKSWEEAAALLPKDGAGRVDWAQALKQEAIAPRASADPKTPAQAVLELDVDLSTSGSRSFGASFSHAAHTAWLACRSCHPAIFPLGRRVAPATVTMASVRKGEHCGVCHGKVAFGVDGECARCHKAIPAKSAWSPAEPKRPIEQARAWSEVAKLLPVAADGSPDWAKSLDDGVIAPRPGVDSRAEDEAVLPLDVELVPKDTPDMKAVFPHQSHTAILSCPTCHTGIFQMAAGADPIDMAKIFAGEYCGRCHGKVAFQVATGCPRCHPVLAGK